MGMETVPEDEPVFHCEVGQECPSEESTWKELILKYTGVVGDFRHLNRKDPFLMKEKKSNIWTELRAGTVTFLTMAYIIPVNANLMAAAIPYKEDLVIATAAVSCIASILMGILSNFPFGLAPGMGLNAYFAFTVVLTYGIPWEDALTSVFFSGIFFIVLSILGLRTFMIKMIPPGIQMALGAGIGIFLAVIGLQVDQGMGIIKGDPITLTALNEPLTVASNYDANKMWLSTGVLMLTVILLAMKVPGAPLLGIAVGTIVSWAECWSVGDANSQLLYPFGLCSDITNISETDCFCYAPEKFAEVTTIEHTAGAFQWSALNSQVFWISTLTFFYNDVIGCGGTLISVARKAGYVDEKGRIPVGNTNMAFLADAIGTVVGSCLGTSTVTSYIESAAGVVDGGRTGLTAIVVGIWFALSIPFAPLLGEIPPLASGPILTIVGALMCTNIQYFNWGDIEEAVPAFATLIMIPLTYNIAYGIIAGAVLWIVIQVGLMPYRMVKKLDPLQKFKMLFRDVDNNDMVSCSVISLLHPKEPSTLPMNYHAENFHIE